MTSTVIHLKKKKLNCSSLKLVRKYCKFIKQNCGIRIINREMIQNQSITNLPPFKCNSCVSFSIELCDQVSCLVHNI